MRKTLIATALSMLLAPMMATAGDAEKDFKAGPSKRFKPGVAQHDTSDTQRSWNRQVRSEKKRFLLAKKQRAELKASKTGGDGKKVFKTTNGDAARTEKSRAPRKPA